MEQSFGEFLKIKRQEKDLTQKELAKLLYVSESAVSKWEKNVAHPDITLLPNISQILGVTEHELITASIDKKARVERAQAKKWRTFSLSWSLFFYISYAIAILVCFICNLAVDGKLSWFWIVFSSLLLSFSFTNLPKLIKKHKLLLLPILIYGALMLLLGVCAIYTKGNWFIISAASILFAFAIVFVPIFISKYKVFERIRKHNEFVSVAIDYVLLNLLLIIIEMYSIANGYSSSQWYLSIALPITTIFYLILNIMMSVKFIKVNKQIKASIILYFLNLIYLVVPFIKLNNQSIQQEINDLNIFNADLSKWIPELTLEQNVSLIIFLTMFGVATIFIIFGILKHLKVNKKIENKNLG